MVIYPCRIIKFKKGILFLCCKGIFILKYIIVRKFIIEFICTNFDIKERASVFVIYNDKDLIYKTKKMLFNILFI